MTILRLNNTISYQLTVDTTKITADSLEITADATSYVIIGVNDFKVYPRSYEDSYIAEFYSIIEDTTQKGLVNTYKAERGLIGIKVDNSEIELKLKHKYIVKLFDLGGNKVWEGKVFVTNKDDDALQEYENFEENNNIIEI